MLEELKNVDVQVSHAACDMTVFVDDADQYLELKKGDLIITAKRRNQNTRETSKVVTDKAQELWNTDFSGRVLTKREVDMLRSVCGSVIAQSKRGD
jgi:hypothetical protein